MSSDFLDLTRDVAKLSDDERKAMYYIMQGEQLPIESVAALSEKARDTITKYGQKMVDVGLLSPETFQKNAATYLRREYASKLKPEGYLTRAANNLRLIGSSLKPRGVIIEISPKNLEKYKAEGWEEFGEAKSGNKIRVRRQLTAEERKAKGEIDDAAYAISRTGQLMSNDIATYKMYDDISKMDQYVSDQPVEGWIQLSGDNIHFRAPIMGDEKNGFVQTDFMFSPDTVWQQWSMRGGLANSPYRGMHRHVLIASIARAQNYKYSYKNGLIDPTTDQTITKNPNEIAKALLGNDATAIDLETTENIIKKIKNRPDYPILTAAARETLSKEGVILPESLEIGSIRWLRYLIDACDR
jgi:hypothetical protein